MYLGDYFEFNFHPSIKFVNDIKNDLPHCSSKRTAAIDSIQGLISIPGSGRNVDGAGFGCPFMTGAEMLVDGAAMAIQPGF